MSLKHWAWLSAMVDLKPATRSKLINAFGDPEALYLADERSVLEKVPLSQGERKLLSDKSFENADRILERCHAEGVSILTIHDAAYPIRLKNIYDPPVALYVKGRLPAMDEQAAVAIVGTRRATPYGIKMARKIAFEITAGGALVVTGLAAGVDSSAAEGALRAGGSCVGVLGCAIDDVFPKFNDTLYADVAAVGALVSEYPPGTAIQSKNFPERNRIVSGLSVGVLIIEAPQRSGALITARLALEQGREVFAVPGNADAQNYEGSNALIREGAALVTSGSDIIDEFAERFPKRLGQGGKISRMEPPDEEAKSVYPASAPSRAKSPSKPETGEGFWKLRVKNERKNVDNQKEREYIDLREQLSELSETQLKIVSVMEKPSMHIDDIIEKSALPAAAVLSELTILEIKGFLSHESGKRFTLHIKTDK